MRIRRHHERGHANHGWLNSYHTFSFADYYHPDHMGFFALRVINDDRVAPGKGFGRHGHRDMEIISYVLEGALQHNDSAVTGLSGAGAVIRPHDVQRMSAGTGVLHSEFNASQKDEVHFLQIWIMPDKKGIPPSYEQKRFGPEEKRGRLRLVASPDGQDGSVTIQQNTRMYAALVDGEERIAHSLSPGRAAWVHVAQGEVRVNGEHLIAGDAAAIGAGEIVLSGGNKAEVLLFDLSSQ